jgi:putative membrane protein
MQQREPYRKLIIVVSIITPLAVAILFGIKVPGYDFTFLPPIYAGVNALTAILLISALIAIRNNKRKLHERLMKASIGLSASFLVMYVLYHMTSDSTPYGGGGPIRYVYFFILISHIILSISVIPLVLFTFARALGGDFKRHSQLARYTFPVWLYVAVTGVIVFFMISPYYNR